MQVPGHVTGINCNDACVIMLVCLAPSVTEEVYCFPRRQLIFGFDRRVIFHSKGL